MSIFRDDYDELEIWVVVVLLLIALAVFFSGIIGLNNMHRRYQCAQYERLTGIPTVYSNWDVCYVETKDGLQRWDEYTMRAATNEDRK
jgi:hypothetical protein